MHKHTYANTQTHTRSNNKLNNITLIKIIFHVLYTCTNIHMQTRKHTRSNNKLNNITLIKIIFHVLYTCTNIHMQTRKHTHVPIINLITLH